MHIGAQASVGDEHIARLSGRVDRLHPGEIVGEQGRDDQLEERPSARMKEPQQVCHGNAAPWPLHIRLAERLLQGWGIRHRAARAIDEEGEMHRPPPVVHGVARHG